MYRNGVAIHGRRDNLFTMENKMTPAQRAHRDKLAEEFVNKWVVNKQIFNNHRTYDMREDFKTGYDACFAEAEEMYDFINAWLCFEKSCIEKDGPYVSSTIPSFMTKAELLLKAWRRE